MRWHEKDILLASADQVAIDAVSAKLQGFDPMSIRFIRRAHELGLGVGDPRQIEIVGYDIEQEAPWNFVQEDTFASRGQKMIYHGPLKPLEKVLLQSPLVPWSYFASNFYHNVYWYPFVGRKRVAEAPADQMGAAVLQLWRWEGGDARHGAQDGRPGCLRIGCLRRSGCRVSGHWREKEESCVTRDAAPPPNLVRRLVAGLVFGFIVVLGLMLAGDIRQVSRQVLAFRWQLFP